jgi:putative methyltransferase (TIGR04325 family)
MQPLHVRATPRHLQPRHIWLPDTSQPVSAGRMDGDRVKSSSSSFRRSIPDAIRTIRLAQIRAFARVLTRVGASRLGGGLICRARDNVLIGPILQWLLAFHGRFQSIEDARICAARYVPASHEHPKQVTLHAEFAEVTRESDYPVLFFLYPIASELRTVFDLGGSIGNLFFQLDRYLNLANELVWTVHDLPFKREPMVEFARKKGERRLSFSDEFSSASGVDLFIVVGAIHFFEPTLAELLRQLDRLPRHVIVNRSPFSNSGDIVTVHDGGLWVNPCKLHSVEKLCDGMRDLGYDLIASWPVNERRVRVPLFPEYNETYFGFYFRLAGGVR